MAPEILLKQPHDQRVDIWALGILMYELFHNKEPFSGKSPNSVLSKIMKRKLDFSSRVPKEAKELINTILRHKKEERPSFP